jgi:hypothetical protein
MRSAIIASTSDRVGTAMGSLRVWAKWAYIAMMPRREWTSPTLWE